MARPVYILAARGISEDTTTRLVSVFSIIERFELRRFQLGADDPNVVRAANRAVAHSVETVVFAVWMREEGDEDAPFEHQFAIIKPDGEQLIRPEQFHFSANSWFHRFRLSLHGIPFADGSFRLEVESRVRRHNTEEWTRQSFPIICDVVDDPGEEPPNPA